jgi:hypothetical protein
MNRITMIHAQNIIGYRGNNKLSWTESAHVYVPENDDMCLQGYEGLWKSYSHLLGPIVSIIHV